jgi:hypothetical protein
MKTFVQRDLLWILPLSLGLGAVLSFLQPGNWLVGWLGFSVLFFLCLWLLTLSTRWADGGKTLAWMVALAFALRFVGGVATYLLLPVDGYANDEDDRAGFVYTDAHRRDDQAWDLASSNKLIGDFNQNYAYDQYGGLLTMSAFIYRYVSPDVHRPLMLVLVSAFMAALGLPFLWKSLMRQWGEKVAVASGWIYTLYPESVLLGGSAMREPYLMAFSAFALWGFVGWLDKRRSSLWWLALGIVGMLFVSPVVALVTLVILAGWMYFASERGRIPWWAVAAVVVVFVAGLFLLSSALDRQGNLGGNTPIAVINNFMRESFKWNAFKIEQGSGWVQKLFDEMPEWLRLPFVMVYGIFQPVLPAAIVEPTTLTWRVIAILRALGWYALLPVSILFLPAASGQGAEAKRRLVLWFGFAVWGWVLFTALRGGGDQWDNPRYRTILFLWQAILAGIVWVWWRETKNSWFPRVLAMEGVFLLFFGQWYANRYYHFGGQLSFGQMVVFILACWFAILLTGWLLDRGKHNRHSV